MIAQFWNGRSTREQGLLIVLAASFAVFVAYYGIMLPLQRAALSADAHRARAAQQWADVQAGAGEIASLGNASGIEEAVTASAEASGVTLERSRVESPREITVWVKGTEPGALFSWLLLLQKAHGVVAANVAATRDDEGALDAELRFAGALP